MNQEQQSGLIAWFVNNPVAANLMMVSIIIAGLFSYSGINKKIFPDMEPSVVEISVPYLGAAPEEVERSVILKIEEAIESIEGLKRIRAFAQPGLARVEAEIKPNYDIASVLDEVRMRVDRIPTFPDEIEEPIIDKKQFQGDVIWVSVSGPLSERDRSHLSQTVLEEIRSLPEVNIAELVGNRDFEITLELSEFKLQKYKLTFDEVAQMIRQNSVDLPGGEVRSDSGKILLRTSGQAFTGREYADIVLRQFNDGTRLLLSDVVVVRDGFSEDDSFFRLNGQEVSSIRVKSTGELNELDIASAVKHYVAQKNLSLPEGVSLVVWGDSSYYLKASLSTMMKNMMLGAILVFLILALFLRLRIAFWVMVGVPVCFLGAFIVMPLLGEWAVSVNVLSLFAFITVLGIVVDDAIITGESVYSDFESKGISRLSVISGTLKISKPATFGVLTTVAAFLPLLFIEANFAAIFRSISIVVIACLLFSLLESKLILPAHLAHANANEPTMLSFWVKIQDKFKWHLNKFIGGRYETWLRFSIRHRYSTFASFIALFFVALALISGGLLKVEVFPNVPSDFIKGSLTMKVGLPVEERNAAMNLIMQAIERVEKRQVEKGEAPFIENAIAYTEGDAAGTFLIELTKNNKRQLNAYEIEKLWREQVGFIQSAKELRFFSGTNVDHVAPIEFSLVSNSIHSLENAAKQLESELSNYTGVYDIRNTFSEGGQEISLELKPKGESLGLTLRELGNQVRQAFFGEEVQRIQRDRNEIKVMLRYPKQDRRSVKNLENMWIRTSDGAEVPFTEVARAIPQSGQTLISRLDQMRAITVAAEIDPALTQSRYVVRDIHQSVLPKIFKQFPDVSSGTASSKKEQQGFIQQILTAFVASILLIYILLAIPTRSYTQPLLIMMVIPFGLIGAIAGHWILGYSLNMLSMFGVVALSGVVVNDSLILIDRVNQLRQESCSLEDAIVTASQTRFRAILLTSLTTFFGVLPVYFESSLQAKFINPMAISIGFGLVFATVISLVLIPCLCMIADDIKRKSIGWRIRHIGFRSVSESK